MYDTHTEFVFQIECRLDTPPSGSRWASRDAGAPAQTREGAKEEGWADLGSCGTWRVKSLVEFAQANETRDSGQPKLSYVGLKQLAI